MSGIQYVIIGSVLSSRTENPRKISATETLRAQILPFLEMIPGRKEDDRDRRGRHVQREGERGRGEG